MYLQHQGLGRKGFQKAFPVQRCSRARVADGPDGVKHRTCLAEGVASGFKPTIRYDLAQDLSSKVQRR